MQTIMILIGLIIIITISMKENLEMKLLNFYTMKISNYLDHQQKETLL